jgi:hypothetical protein
VDTAEFSRIEHSNVIELCACELKSILKTGKWQNPQENGIYIPGVKETLQQKSPNYQHPGTPSQMSS